MKKILSLAVLLSSIFYANAQPVIQLTGTGVYNTNETHTLTFSNPETIDKVVVEAMAIFRLNEGDALPVDVNFENFNGDHWVSYQKTEKDHSHLINGVQQMWGYYTKTFDEVDAGGITLHKNGQTKNIVSFVAYVYRDGSMEVYSEVNYMHAFIFLNGSDDPTPCIYEFDIPPAGSDRDIHITLPISDLASGYTPRYAIVTASAGPVSLTKEYSSNNSAPYLNIGELVLSDVPGEVTKVYVKIYSPKPASEGGIDEKIGDSFITGAVLITVEQQQPGCTLTQGYWKTHSIYGPAKKADPVWELLGPDTDFFLSGKSYIEAIKMSPAGNAYYILAQQYIAAELNFLAGADNSAVMDEFDEATELFETYMPETIAELKGNDPLRKQFIELSKILDNYNMGLIGPGHCDNNDYETEQVKAAVSLDAKVYPNPIRNNARITFMPVADGKATVELFNPMGHKVSTLFHQTVKKDVPVDLQFKVQNLNKGSYILMIRNGQAQEDCKVQIVK